MLARALFLSPAILAVSGCMLAGVNYTAPDTITPDSWHQSLHRDLNSDSSSLETWWTRFNDPTLNRLIDKARESNRDLAVAYERINEARAARGAARSQLFPQLDFNGGVARGRGSENVGLPSPPAGSTIDTWASGIDAGWEIDLFGGIRRSIEAADASAAGTEELYRDTMVSLLAEVAIAYIQIRTIDERLRVAQRNIKNQTESVEFTNNRLEAGLSPELDVAQAKTNLAVTSAVVPSLQNQRDISLNRLATLIGRYPEAAASYLGGSGNIPVPKKSAGLGIPADLVRSRPDIRAAERDLAAQTARIGVAEIDLYPRFTLSGTFQLQANAASNLLQSSSRNYSFGPGFRWNIFNAGRIKNQIAIEESRTKQAYLRYENTVLKAVEEVENSLSSIRTERQRLGQLSAAVTASNRTVELVQASYGEGLTDFQNVLDAQRTIFSTEDAKAVSEGQVAAAYVALFKSLGGGTPMRAAN